MKTFNTVAWTALIVLGVPLMGCDPIEGTSTEIGEGIKEQVELTSVTDMVEEGEVVSFNVKSGDGTVATHEYVVRNGELEPLGDAPEMTLPESHELGVIPVSINGGADYAPSASTRGPGEASADSWTPSRLESGVPAIQVDRTFRVETDALVQQLRNQGRAVEATPFPETGPSRATELTRLEVDGLARAEVYQFDDAQALDAWYRVAYQLHESAGHDPDARIVISGMTMMRLGDHADGEIPEAFLATQRAAIQSQ